MSFDFNDLFVLELANNHLGSVERGLRIIREHAAVVKAHGVRAAIKLQLRDVGRFIHKDWRERKDIRYIKKTLDTRLSLSGYAKLVDAIRDNGCIVAATPFDEESVRNCVEYLGMDLLKLASSDVNDWPLIEAVAATGKPVIASTGGSSLQDIDNLVAYFRNRNLPLALNHCVSIYPSEDHELELNQIDFLKRRYPDHVIGFSTHEYRDWQASMLLSYAKGARMWERHIDLDEIVPNEYGVYTRFKPSPYCSSPWHIAEWFRAYYKAREMCGGSGEVKRIPPAKEVTYLDALVRGVYARRDLPKGYTLRQDTLAEDVYLAIPLQKGQLSCRELKAGETLTADVKADAPLRIDDIAGWSGDKELVYKRGI